MGIRRRGNFDPGKSLREIQEGMERRAPAALTAAALVFVGAAIEVLSTPGRGAIRGSGRDRQGKGSYRRVGGKMVRVRRGAARTRIDLTNRASAPGDSPAPDTGALRASFGYDMVSPSSVRVGTNMEYAAPLEFGTTRIAPRPFMRPAMAKARDSMGEAVISELREQGSGPQRS